MRLEAATTAAASDGLGERMYIARMRFQLRGAAEMGDGKMGWVSGGVSIPTYLHTYICTSPISSMGESRRQGCEICPHLGE